MTRSEKFQKLANAVREYRGMKNGHAWIRSPRPSALARVVRWAEELGLDAKEIVAKVQGFKTIAEFQAWLCELQSEPAHPTGLSLRERGGAA